MYARIKKYAQYSLLSDFFIRLAPVESSKIAKLWGVSHTIVETYHGKSETHSTSETEFRR